MIVKSHPKKRIPMQDPFHAHMDENGLAYKRHIFHQGTQRSCYLCDRQLKTKKIKSDAISHAAIKRTDCVSYR